MRFSAMQRELPGDSPTMYRGACKSLITDEPWDCYHLGSLLPLKEIYRENTEFGFLIRHYWIPATILTYRQSSRTALSNVSVELCELEIERKMARCRSNECLWRKKVFQLSSGNGNGDESDARPLISEMLCSYDCYDQTYVSHKPVLFAQPTPDQKTEARRQALYRLPMLCPPGPVPIGVAWHAKVEDHYMNFCLEAEESIGERGTSVLVVRREGRYTEWLPEESVAPKGGAKSDFVVTEPPWRLAIRVEPRGCAGGPCLRYCSRGRRCS